MEGLNLPDNVPVTKKDIRYVYIQGLEMLKCRGVWENGKNTGEYHVRSLKVPNFYVCNLINGTIENAVADDIDADGALHLEYPICIKVDSILSNETMEESMKEIDNILKQRK